MEGRQILDGIMVTHEVIHSLNIIKIPRMIIKLYLSQSYDKMNYNYLCMILLAFEFAKELID